MYVWITLLLRFLFVIMLSATNTATTSRRYHHSSRTAQTWCPLIIMAFLLANLARFPITRTHDNVTSSSRSSVASRDLTPNDDRRRNEDMQLLSLKNSTTTPTCLIVYHVPKTGGTSMEVYLSLLADKLGWTLYRWDGFATSSKPNARMPFLSRLLSFQYNIIHEGHLMPAFEYVTNTQCCAKLTTLRDPIDRVLSAFFFHRQSDRQHKLTTNDAFEEAWKICLYKTCIYPRFEYMNDVVRRFSCGSSSRNHRQCWWNSFDEKKYVGDGRSPPNDLNEDDLEAAKQRLLSFNAVCFLESNMKNCFEKFVSRTWNINLELPKNDVKKNKGRRKPSSISDKMRRDIARVNRLDIKLYEWALDTFINKKNNETSTTTRIKTSSAVNG